MSEYAKLVISVDSTQARTANKDLGALERGASTLTAGLGRMIGPLVSVATAMAALNKASDVQRQFDVLNAGLITATGSTEKAAVAFKALQSFAQKTPYDLNQAVEGFTKLVNLGLTPSERALTSYGNTASAMGKDLNQMIEAVADATTGEFERLKDFGIKSKVTGDSVAFTFQGVTKSVGNNAAAIEKYLTDLGENEFDRAMKVRMDTLDGAFANLADTWDTTFRLINEAGLGEAMRDSVNEAIAALDEFNAQLASGELEATLSAIAGKFGGFGRDIEQAFDEISKLFESDSGYWSSLLEHNVANMTATFRDLPENVRAFMKLMTVEVLSGFDTVKAYARAFNDGINAIFSNDTFEGVGVRLDAELSAVSKTRQDGIQYILNEREASLASFDAQIKGATERRRAFDEAAAADAADTTDRLAQFKAITDGSKAQSDEDKKAAKAAETLVNQRKKALDSLILQSAISIKSSNAMADAYLAGADSVRELAIQQKIEEELLKTGAGARKEVEAAIRGQADAEDRLAVAKSAYDLGKETEDILAQATATLQGTAALEAYNVQKAMQVALAGKNVAVGSQEYEQLLAATKAQQEAVKIAKQASDAGSIMDRLYPEKKLLREYTEAQAALNKAMELAPDKAAEYQDALRLLGLEYEQNKNAATAWGQFTEGALDRVDGAFADAWKNIGDGFDGFATSLKDGFKQLLAELAHMAITRPIVMQIGAALGVGGLSAQSGGLFGGGGGSGGLGLFDMASKAYGVATSGFGSAVSAGWSAGEGFLGGMQGAISGGYNYISSGLSGLFGGGAASSLAGGAGSNVGYGLGQSLVSGNIGSSTMATSSAGGLSASAPYLSAISGAIMGYQNSGVKGAAAGAAGGYLGVKGGAAVGSYFGPIGTAVGAVIGGILGSVGGSKLFGGDWVTKDTGLSLAVEDGDFLGKRYEYQKKKGGLFGKNKKRTRYSALDPEMQAALDATYDATEGSVLDLFDRLNVELNDGVLDGLNIGAQKISTKDKTAEEIQAEIAKWFGGVADSMVSAVDAATAAGLGGYNFEGLTAFVQNLEGVNEVVRYLNVGMYDVSVAGGKLAEQLSAIAGGLDVLQSNAATYYGAFISESERMDDTLDAVTRAFVAANQTLPETRTGFRDMVESIDTTTQAGMQMFSTLMALSGQASTYYDILEQRASNGVNAAFAAVQRAIAAQQKAINKSLTDANSRISDLTGISNALGSALKQLRGTGDDAVRMLRSQAQATLQSALAIAKAGGSLSGFAGLTDALDVLGSNNTDLYGSLEEFNRDQGRTANAVAELNKLNGKQLSAAEKSALAMQAQLDALDAQLEFAQAQVDALNGIDNSVKSVADAVKEMNAAVVAAIASISGKSTPQNAGVLIDSIYKDQLGRDADAEGKQYWVDQLASGALNNQNIVGAITNAAAIEAAYKAAGIAMNEGASYWAGQLDSGALTPDQLQEAVRNAAIANGSIPAYASGGLITGPGTGTSDSIIARLSNGEYVMSADAVRMFGTGLLDQMNAGRLPAFAQGGPVLDIPSPNQVFGSSRADVISGGSDNGALLAKFEQLLEANKSQRFQIAKYAQQVAQLLQKWDVEGAPKERDYA
nr:Baculovirus polyhedron envelope protein, PEP, C terminus [Pseudomonas putida]